MNIIIVGRRHSTSRHFTLGPFLKRFVLGVLITLPFLMGGIGYFVTDYLVHDGLFDSNTTAAWEKQLAEQDADLEEIRAQANQEIQALTIRMAEMQGRLLRIDALGERLVDLANLDGDEFNFSDVPAVGGPEELGAAYQLTDLESVMNELSDKIDNREYQLEILDSLMEIDLLDEATFVAGRPITKGWMSSRYGRRTDPFSGRPAWHAGVDFAGKMGSDIVSVAAGVVTISGKRSGYGLLVEVNHGDGYKTRYAHCKETKVKVGDVVRKGDVIATMGSSGRSTGPHVHFEVYKNGRTVDPAKYIHRKHG